MSWTAANHEGPEALASYDAIVIGAPTRFGRMPSQMASFLDTTGGLWMRGPLIGKVGAAFTSTGSQHGPLPLPNKPRYRKSTTSSMGLPRPPSITDLRSRGDFP